MMLKKHRIFMFAILISAIWHCFWIWLVRIDISPKDAAPIRFSKVSFLGAILDRGAIEVRVKPKEREFLEKRYLSNIEDIALPRPLLDGHSLDKYESNKTIDVLNNDTLVALIDESVSGSKLEPALDPIL